METLRKRLHHDAGENSLMVVVSQMVSLLVMGSLAGLMFILITGGVRVQAENVAQTELRIANRAFITDVENAATVYELDDTSVTLTSTKFLKGADSDGDLDYQCRDSQWVFEAASDEVRKSRGNETLMSVRNNIAVHETDDCSSPVTSTQSRIAVAAITEESRFVYTNVAGVPLSYSNGIVTTFTGLDSASSNAADITAIDQFRAAHSVSDWYTDAEMLREHSAVIEAQLTAFLPISHENAASFKATTNESETELVGDNDGIVDPGGEQTRWVPNPVAGVFVQRSPDTGAVVGGQREGLQVSWTARPSYECSPTQTLTYSWLVTNIRTNKQSSGETAATVVQVTTGTGGNAQIWNGGTYFVQVSARCNDVDGQSGDRSTTYTLPLPEVINVDVTPSANQTTHSTAWATASSDPTTTYSVQYAAANVVRSADYIRGNLAWEYPSIPYAVIAGSPTAATSISKSGNTVVPGYPDTYRVRAATADSPNTSGIWTPANYIYRVVAPSAPVIDTSTATGGSWDAVTCTTNTSAQYRPHFSNTLGGANTTPATPTSAPQNGTSISFGSAINEGSRVWVRVDARCVTRFTLDPTNGQSTATLSPFSPPSTDDWIRPITTPLAPSGLTTPARSVGNGTTATNAWSNPTCAVGTVLNLRHQLESGAPTSDAWLGAATSRSTARPEAPGTNYGWRVLARCESDASGEHVTADSGWASAAFYSDVPAPSVSVTASRYTAQSGGGITVYVTLTGDCAAQTSRAWTASEAGTWYRTGQHSENFYGSLYCVGADGHISSIASDSVYLTWLAPAPSAPSGGNGTFIMTCDYVNGGYQGFSGWIEWNASSNATSYSVTMRYTTEAGTTAAVDLGTSSSQRRTYQSNASSNSPGVKITVTANGPGGSTSAAFSPDRVPGGCA
jgi:hypothetical protein